MRDIQHEQIQASTDAELADRLTALRTRYSSDGYPLAPVSYTHLTLPTNREV